jgi:Flp pilus assembly protein TadG
MIRPIQITRRDLSKTRKRTWGGSVLEAAFIVPILVSLAFGMAEFSYFFFVKHTLEGAAREGARNAITPTATNATATAAATAALTAAGGNSWGATVAITDTSGNALTVSGLAAGTAIEVKLSCTWSTVGVHPLGIIPGSKLVIGTCVMRKEG